VPRGGRRRQAVGCGKVGDAGTAGGMVGGTPIASFGGGTCSGHGEGTPGGTLGCGVSGGVRGRAGAGLGFVGVGCGLLESTCWLGFCIEKLPYLCSARSRSGFDIFERPGILRCLASA
jgi:hypothetical protein